jgi:hypothetical protein
MKSKLLLCLALVMSGGLTVLTASCGKRSDSTSESGDQLLVPLTVYHISQFTNFQSFEAQIVTKDAGSYLRKSSGETNYFVEVILLKTNGEEFAISENPTSENMFRVINSLEKGRSYIFPNVLISSNRENVAH